MKTRKIVLAGFLLTVFIMFTTAISNAQLKGNGNITKEARELEPFNKIELSSVFHAFIKQNAKQYVYIETDENILGKIHTKVKDNKLIISNKSVMPTELNVYIDIPELEEITISGAAKIENKGLFTTDFLKIKASGASETKMEINVKELKSDVSGAAELTLTGEAINHNIEVSGAGNIYAEGLKTKKVSIDASGAGNANVDATEELTIVTSGVAEVRYKDEPPVFNAEDEVIRIEREDEDFVYGNDPDKVNIKALGMDIEVIEDDDSTNIVIGRHNISVDDEGNVKHKRCKCKKFNGHWAGFDLGVNGYLTPNHDMNFKKEDEYLDLKMHKSIKIGLNFFEQNLSLSKNQKWGLVTGLGWEINNYRFYDDVYILPDTTKMMGFYVKDLSQSKSKMVINYLEVPLLFEFQTNRYRKTNSFHLTAGMVFGLRIISHTKRYVNDLNKEFLLVDPGKGETVLTGRSSGVNKPKKWDDFHLNPFKADATVRIGWGWINLFGTYSITTLFREGKGPELYPFSAGLTLIGW